MSRTQDTFTTRFFAKTRAVSWSRSVSWQWTPGAPRVRDVYGHDDGEKIIAFGPCDQFANNRVKAKMVDAILAFCGFQQNLSLRVGLRELFTQLFGHPDVSEFPALVEVSLNDRSISRLARTLAFPPQPDPPVGLEFAVGSRKKGDGKKAIQG